MISLSKFQLLCYEITFYLYLALWVWLTAVITFEDSPRARYGHVFLEMFPLDCNVTVFVCTGDNFKKTRCQVDLLHTQKKICDSAASVYFKTRARQFQNIRISETVLKCQLRWLATVLMKSLILLENVPRFFSSLVL